MSLDVEWFKIFFFLFFFTLFMRSQYWIMEEKGLKNIIPKLQINSS